jgi:hypothetical protein
MDATNTLPRQAPTLISAGYGDGTACGVCEQPITATDVEYDLYFYDDDRSFRMHLRCYAVWESGREAG